MLTELGISKENIFAIRPLIFFIEKVMKVPKRKNFVTFKKVVMFINEIKIAVFLQVRPYSIENSVPLFLEKGFMEIFTTRKSTKN